MTMLDRRSRTNPKSDRFGRKRKAARAQAAPPPSAGPDEETVRIARKDFRKRRHAGRWRRVRAVSLVLLLVAVLSACVWLVFFSSYVTARTVDVTGTRAVGEAKVNRAAELPTGMALARVDLDAIAARV